MAEKPRLLDLGCGPKKIPGAFGVDIHPYEEVDKVIDLNQYPWDLESNAFDRIVCRHVIEHVDNITEFMKEIHRISSPNATVYIETPHFSSINSWADPTHKGHFSAHWYKVLGPESYLSAQTGIFEGISSTVTFGKSLRNKIGKLIVKLRGVEKWEKTSAFTYPGSDVITELRVVKGQSSRDRAQA